MTLLKQISVSLFLLLFFHPGKAQEVKGLEANFKAGLELMEQSRFQEAIPVFRKIITALPGDKKPLLKAKATKELAFSLIFSGQPDAALKAYDQAIYLAQKIDNLELIVKSAAGIGEIYFMRSQHVEALKYHQLVVKAGYQMKDFHAYSNALSMTGYDYLVLGNLDSAKWYIEKGFQVKRDQGIEADIMLNYDHMASLHTTLNNKEKAMEFMLLGTAVLEAQEESAPLAMKYCKLANAFIVEKNLERAKEYSLKSIAISRKLDLSYYLSISLTTLAEIKEKEGQYEEALTHLQEALALNQNTNNEGGVVNRLFSIVDLYTKQGFYENAEEYFSQVLPIVLKRNQPTELAKSYLVLGRLKILQQKLPEVKVALDAAQIILDTFEDLNKKQELFALKSAYFEQVGQFQKAVQAGQEAALLHDSIFTLEKSARVHELEEQFERAKKEKEITLLNAKKDIKDLIIKENKRTNIITLIGLLLACGFIISLYSLYRLRRRINQKLEEKNNIIAKALREKEILLKEIHHRVKNNLQVVSSLLRLQSNFIKDSKALDALQEGRNRVKSMAIIHQNLYQKNNLVGVSVKEYIEKLSESLFNSYNIQPSRINLKTHIDELNLDVDTIIPLGLILNELLTNALKYAFPNETKGTVAVTLKEEKEYLLLEVKDNGIGIKTEGIATDKDGGFGIKLIDTFAVKLKAKFQIQQQNGTIARLLIHNYQTT